MEAKNKAVNYTEENVAEMVDLYTANPCRETVNSIASQFEKTVRSVIAKLSAEGVYIKQVKAGKTKTGDTVVRKSDIVEGIEKFVGDNMPSLEKVNKADLQKLITFLQRI